MADELVVNQYFNPYFYVLLSQWPNSQTNGNQ